MQKTLTETILQEAQRIAHGDRQDAYGDPFGTYDHAAEVVNALLRSKLNGPLTAHDMALVMAAVKMVREIRNPKRDNRVDLAGFAWVADRCVECLPAPNVPTGTQTSIDESIPEFLRPPEQQLVSTPAPVDYSTGNIHPEGDPLAPWKGCACATCNTARFRQRMAASSAM